MFIQIKSEGYFPFLLMDVLYSPSKIRQKPVEIIFVGDSDSPSSSVPPAGDMQLLYKEDSDSDDILIESESFISTSDELIDGISSFSEDSELNSDVTYQTKEKAPPKESLIPSSSLPKADIQKNPRIPQQNNYFNINLSSSNDDYSQTSLSSSYSSQIYSSSSSVLSSQKYLKFQSKLKNNYKSKPLQNHQNKKSKNNYVDDLDDFIDQDEYSDEEDEMNTSDRDFIADSQVTEDISLYRLCDINKHDKKSKAKTINSSSSESDFESSLS